MRATAAWRSLSRRLTLTRQVALLSLVPIVLLGVVLAHVLQAQVVARTLADESQTARLIARIGVQPRLQPRDLRDGLSAAEVSALDQQLRTAAVKHDLARIKIWNADDTVIYSDDHTLIGRKLSPSDDLEDALAGRPKAAALVTPRPHTETAGEVGLGRLVEVYVPLRFTAAGPTAGAFEMYLSYQPIAAAIEHDKTMIALLIALGLAVLWLALYRIVRRASRRLAQQARDNDRLARYDRLTGLPNRVLFAERLGGWLQGARPEGAAVMIVDVDAFKQINATLGSATGDEVLREVAQRLGTELAGAKLIARLGNDEFAVLCWASRDRAHGSRSVAAGVLETLARPMTLGGVALNVEASVGVAPIDADGASAEELLKRAEAALARARSRGSRVETYSSTADRFDPAQLILLGQVRDALERHELVLHYQPKLELRSGRVTGVEALVRWQHPERGLLGPMEFIPLIEPTTLVDPVTHYVLEEAACQLRAWRERGIELEMSVNLSARNLLDAELPEKVFEILARHRVPPASVTLEVTESATMSDPANAIHVLERLRAGGLGVSVDDFGTGNASLDYLARLPATEIKIDRSFISAIGQDARGEAIVRSTIELARHLELNVVAEGIETAAALERLTALECDAGQGYFISPPLPAEELTDRLPRATSSIPRANAAAAAARLGSIG